MNTQNQATDAATAQATATDLDQAPAIAMLVIAVSEVSVVRKITTIRTASPYKVTGILALPSLSPSEIRGLQAILEGYGYEFSLTRDQGQEIFTLEEVF